MARSPESACAVIDVATIIEGQPRRGFMLQLTLLLGVVTFFDGFDMQAIVFAAPYMAHELNLTKLMIGSLFSAGLAGSMVGAMLFGWLGDRFGRRPCILVSVIGFGVATLAFALAREFNALLILRFVNGVAVGGALPLAWAMVSEFAPRRSRATIITVVMVGFTLGSSIGGPVSIVLAPNFGWQAIFVFAGAATMLASVVLFLKLPESIRFLINSNADGERIVVVLRRIDPATAASARTVFRLDDEMPAEGCKFRLSMLFAGRLRIITPLLWLAYVGSSASLFLFSSWTPIILESQQFTRASAALFTSLVSLQSVVVGLFIARFTDRRGPIWIAMLPAIVLVLFAIILLGSLGPTPLVIVYLAGITLIGGTHHAINSIAALPYPTAIRANGAGSALSVSKLGGISGPLIGGVLLSSTYQITGVYLFMMTCVAVVGTCLLFIGSMFATAAERDRSPAAQ